jgi:hypothetical protein
MKKILFMLPIILSACSHAQTNYFPYDAGETFIGKGALFIKEVNGVKFYKDGLPKGQRCKLIGKANDSRKITPSTTEDDIIEDVSEKVKNVGNTVISEDFQVETTESYNPYYGLRQQSNPYQNPAVSALGGFTQGLGAMPYIQTTTSSASFAVFNCE